jgi:hypothetical protein
MVLEASGFINLCLEGNEEAGPRIWRGNSYTVETMDTAMKILIGGTIKPNAGNT